MRHVVLTFKCPILFKLKKICGFRCVIDIGCSHFISGQVHRVKV
jgi:hypothetical protein